MAVVLATKNVCVPASVMSLGFGTDEPAPIVPALVPSVVQILLATR